MGIFKFLFRKNEHSLKEDQSKHTEFSFYSDDQIKAIASLGFRTDWLSGISNENLFPMMFEWIETRQYTKTLRFKSLRSKEINYAPYIILYCDNDVFYYDGDWTSNKITINCGSIGNAIIPYPRKCMIQILAPHIHFDIYNTQKGIQVEDYSDILKIDYSSEAISKGEQMQRDLLVRETKEREDEELKKIKENLLKQKKRKELKEKAIQELKRDKLL